MQPARAANVMIAAQKASLEGSNVDQILRDLQRLRATKTRHSSEVSKACNEHAAELTNKEILEGKKTTAREKLDAHTKTVIKTYEKTINRLLEDFQAGFRITGQTRLPWRRTELRLSNSH